MTRGARRVHERKNKNRQNPRLDPCLPCDPRPAVHFAVPPSPSVKDNLEFAPSPSNPIHRKSSLEVSALTCNKIFVLLHFCLLPHPKQRTYRRARVSWD